MVFVADDLAAWLTGLLADTSRKKLTALVLGTELERALRSAATTAVRLTAQELRPGGDEQAEHVALVISQVFSKPVPGALFISSLRVIKTLCGCAPGGASPQVTDLLDHLDEEFWISLPFFILFLSRSQVR
jgi:hypothetical protein